jgi:hypothetical protein
MPKAQKEFDLKVELISFIKYKLSYDKEYLNSILPDLKKMSYADLKVWSIRNDIID